MPGIGPKHYLDFVLDSLVQVSGAIAGITELQGNKYRDAPPRENFGRIQVEALRILQQMESVLACLQPIRGHLPTFERQETGATPRDADRMRINISQYLESFLAGDISTPTEFVAYNVANICRTAAMSLRLLMCNLISIQKGNGFLDSKEQRAALMWHVEAVVKQIPWSSQREILGVAPICFVPSFRAARAVLARECEALNEEVGKEAELARCQNMEKLLDRHLDFIASKKISIKIDL